MRKAALQRGVGIALWRQIADEIQQGILTGLADSAGRLPPETELAARFGVNRHTVRAAISSLVHEGVLRVEQGRGTYIRRRKRMTYPIGPRTRFSEGLEGQAQDRGLEVVGHSVEAAIPAIATALGVETGAGLIRLETLGKADGVPVVHATSWFDERRFPVMAEAAARLGSITAALKELGTSDYLRASTVVEARHADPADMHELRLSPGAIVLVTKAINVDPRNVPIQYSESRFPADRIELAIGS